MRGRVLRRGVRPGYGKEDPESRLYSLSRYFQGRSRASVHLPSTTDTIREDCAQQRCWASCPQVQQRHSQRFPHCPQISLEFPGSFGRLLAERADTGRPQPMPPLTLGLGRRYNHQALLPTGSRIGGVAREAYVPAQHTQAQQDTRIPRADVHACRASHTRKPSPQGPRGSFGLSPFRLSGA
jgi:hypothetical protein